MILYDFKSLTRYPTISWTVSKTRNFFADFRDENYNRNTAKRKIITFLKREINFLTLTEKKNTISRQNWTRLHYCRALACTFTDSAETFLFENGTAFSKFLSNLDFQDSQNETPNKRIRKMTDEELEKSIDALFFPRFTRYMTLPYANYELAHQRPCFLS